MKKLLLALILLLGLQTYGVYGASKAETLSYDCHLEIGILCFDWRPNPLRSFLGDEQSEALDDEVEAFEEAWRDEMLERLKRDGTQGFETLLERLKELGREGLDRARDAVSERENP